jgi:hypothetical protein
MGSLQEVRRAGSARGQRWRSNYERSEVVLQRLVGGFMDIKRQMQLIRRIQADFRKEAHKHRSDGNGLAATDCDWQADALDSVLATLKGVALMAEAVGILTSNDRLHGREGSEAE